MFWNKFAQDIRAEYDKDPKNYLRARNFTKAYSGKYVSTLQQATKNDPYIEQVVDPDIGGAKIEGKASQSTMRSVLYIRELEKHIDPNQIEWLTDFGPGYGNHVRVWDKLFKTKYYQLIDLEELHDISINYLQACGIHVNIKTHSTHIKPKGKSLFWATHSLSECEMEIRHIVEGYLPQYDHIYISYNDNFIGINNIEYFKELAERLPHKTEIHFDKVTGKHRLIGSL